MNLESSLLGRRYTRGDLIGRGATGCVYRGLDTKTGQGVAIKLLDGADPALAGQFKVEAELLRILAHPSVVALRAYGIHLGIPFLVTDLAEGESLRAMLTREHRLSVTRTLEIAIDVASGLHHAHRHGVIHRDVKPDNVVFAGDGTPRLTDFGVAAIRDLESKPAEGHFIGTMAYLSPEGFRGEPLGPESDVWSLGLVLFEMLTGSLPFGTPSTEAELPGLVDRPVPLLGEFRPEAPQALALLLGSMLERDRDARASDAGDVTRRLEEILTELEASGQPSGIADAGLLPTPFLGREREQEHVLYLITDREHPLVSLVGPGGIGKTRLAMEVAAEAAALFPDGVCLVPLAAVPSPDLMVPAIAGGLGLTLRGTSEPEAQMLAFLSSRRLLLVLDSMEHLVDGAALIEEMIKVAPGVILLVTSRERLGVSLETVVEINGLDIPSATDAPDPGKYPALRLFEQAALRTSAGFAPGPMDWESIAVICQLVDGNPLGIELAAASVAEAACEAIAGRLSQDIDLLAARLPGVPPRHRSMRAVFDHSWILLRETERGVYRRLAVFRGGFTLAAARAVAGCSLAMLSSLMEKSLLARSSSNRYALHELLRQFAGEELNRSPHERTEVAALHVEFYGRFVQEREDTLQTASDQGVFGEIESEMPNIRAAWEAALCGSDADQILPYLKGMHRFFEYRSRFREGEAAFEKTVAALRGATRTDDTNRRALAVAMGCRSALLYRLSRFPEARDLASEARALAEGLQRPVEAASAANTAGLAALALGETSDAIEHISHALAIWETVGNLQGQGACHCNLGMIADDSGQIDVAIDHYQRALTLLSRIDHKPGRATVLQNLAGLMLHRGDVDHAQRLAEEELTLARSVGDRLGESRALASLGIVDQRRGDQDSAVRRLEASIAIKREIGDSRGLANALAHLGISLAARGLDQCASAIFEEAHDEAEAIGDRHHQGMAMMFRADHAMQLDKSAEAERCYREAMVHALDTGALPQVTEIVRGVARLKNRFGNMAGALEAFLVGRAQPYYQESLPSLDAAIADLQGVLALDTVEEVRASVATETLEEFARKLLAEPRWT